MSKKEISPSEQHFSGSQIRPGQGVIISGSNETSQKSSGSTPWKNDDVSSKHSGDCAIYDSGRADSGFLSETNIHSGQCFSEEISDPPSSSHTSPTKSGECDIFSSGEQKGETKSYMRLDSGVDVGLDSQFNQLSIKDISLNDLNSPSIKSKNYNLKGSAPANINVQFSNSVKTSSSGNTEPPVAVTVQPPKPQDISSWELYFKQDEDGDTQLHIAIIKEFIEVVFSLVRMVPHPSYLDIRNDDCQTPLHLAVLTRQPRMVTRLLCAGASPEIRDRHGNTALHLAVAGGDISCVRALMEPIPATEINAAQLRYTPYSKNTAVNTRDLYNYDGLTCVHLAALNGHIEILRYLVWFGANINAREWKGGRTPLHLAIERQDALLCRFLLAECRIDLDAETYAGITPYQMAVRIDSGVARQLRERGCDTYLELTDDEEDDDDDDNDDEMLGSTAFHGFRINGGGVVNVSA